MHTVNIRNLFYLLGTKVILVLFLSLAFAPKAEAQFYSGDNYNFFDFQQKPYYFGITLALNRATFQPFRSREFIFSDSISAVQSISGPGFNLGIVTNLKIGNFFDFRFLPTLSFATRNLDYTKTSSLRPNSQRSVESVFVELPFHFRYKSVPYKDKRLFLIAGVKYAFDVASDSRARQAETLVKISQHDFSIEYGA